MKLEHEPRQRCGECGAMCPTLLRMDRGPPFCWSCLTRAADVLSAFPWNGETPTPEQAAALDRARRAGTPSLGLILPCDCAMCRKNSGEINADRRAKRTIPLACGCIPARGESCAMCRYIGAH